jgi:hypothetical protein
MLRKPRAISFITSWSLALALLLLATGCVAIPATQPAPVTTTWGGQTPLESPLPSLLLADVQAYPSDAFRLRILVRNNAGEPAPGAKLFITFYSSGEAPVEVRTDDRGYAVLDLHAAELTLPDAYGNESGGTSGTLAFAISAFWDTPNGGFEFLFGVVSQEIDLSAPSEIAVNADLSSTDTASP